MTETLTLRSAALHIVLRAMFISLLLLPAVTAFAVYAVPHGERVQWIITVPFVFAAGELLARLFAGRRKWLLEATAVLLTFAYVYVVYGTTKVSYLSDIVFAAVIVYGTIRPRDGSVWSVPPFVFITSFFLYAIISFVLQEEPGASFYSRLLNISAAATLVIALFLFNKNVVRRESYSDHNGSSVSRSIMWHNRLMVAILGIVTLIVSFLSDISIWLRQVLSQVLNQLKEWLDRKPYEDKVSDVSGGGNEVTLPYSSSDPNRWIELFGAIAQYIGTAIGVALVLWLLYRIARKLPFVVRMIERWIQRMMGKERIAAEQAGYEDETEKIDHSARSDRFKRFASRILPGRNADEWDLLPDNEARIRYLYRSALLSRKRSGYNVKPHLTPRETAQDLHGSVAGIRELAEPIVELYERARYGGAAIEDREAETARLLEKPSKKQT